MPDHLTTHDSLDEGRFLLTIKTFVVHGILVAGHSRLSAVVCHFPTNCCRANIILNAEAIKISHSSLPCRPSYVSPRTKFAFHKGFYFAKKFSATLSALPRFCQPACLPAWVSFAHLLTVRHISLNALWGTFNFLVSPFGFDFGITCGALPFLVSLHFSVFHYITHGLNRSVGNLFIFFTFLWV